MIINATYIIRKNIMSMVKLIFVCVSFSESFFCMGEHYFNNSKKNIGN